MKFQSTWLPALCAYFTLMFPMSILASTVIGPVQIDAISSWSVAGSPYVIQGDVVVNAKLTIEPGVRVEFSGPYTLKITPAGVLNAKGTATDNIFFTATVPVQAKLMFTGSSGIDAIDALFDNTGAYKSGSILEYVVVENIGGVDTNGAVVLFGAHPYLHNSIFRNNGASGIYAYLIDGDLRIENNEIVDNRAQLGAGLYLATQPNSKLSVRGNKVRNNTVSGEGNGGGLHLTVGGLATNITANVFEKNTASNSGGGMYLTTIPGTGIGVTALSGNIIQTNNAGIKGGGVYTHNITITMTGETVRSNSAGPNNGGGLFLEQSHGTITKSMILQNHSTTMGGGIFLSGGTYTFRDSVLALNVSGKHGGGIDMHGLPTVLIDHSVIAGNIAKDYGAAVSMTEGICTITNSAIVLNETSSAIGIYVGANLQANTIAYNTISNDPTVQLVSLGSTIGVGANTGPDLAINANNIFRNATPYDIVSFDGGTALNARSNWWGTVDAALISSRTKVGDGVPDATIDSSLSRPGPNIDAPISPPRSITATATATSIKLEWNPNPEIDTQGYKVYWGSKPFPDYEGFFDVGNLTSYEIQNLSSEQIKKMMGGSGFVAVTAYDTGYVASTDDAGTPVNENQTQGHESWYSVPSSAIALIADPVKHQKYGDVVYFHITVSNTGPSVGDKDFIITHTITPELSYYYVANVDGTLSAVPNLPSICSVSSADKLQVTCQHAPIAPNTSVELIIATLVNTSSITEAVSTATVRPAVFDANSAESRAQVTLHVNAPDLEVSWANIPPAKTGESIEYKVTVKNNGQVPALGSVLSATIPAAFTINVLDARCTSAISGGGELSCNLGNLAGNAEVSIVFSLTGTMPGDIVLTAQVSTTGDSDASNNQAHLSTTLVSQVQGNNDSDPGIDTSVPRKKGGGVIDLMGFIMLISLLATRRRFPCLSAV